jgi:hypothetical protein
MKATDRPFCPDFKDGAMTMRDHLASMAMQGILANKDTGCCDSPLIAQMSYHVADAMIAESNRKPDTTEEGG